MTKRIEVFVRIRSGLDPAQEVWRAEDSKLYCVDRREETCFEGYEGVFHLENNTEIYEKSIRNVVDKFLKEENGTVFAYGQTGSGKTYTILGETNVNIGIIHLCLEDILRKQSVFVSYLEIYNEKIYDLNTKNELRIYSVDNIHTVSNLSSTLITSQNAFYNFLIKCETNKKYGFTEYNNRSSRSHTVFQIKFKESTFNLIDLAGSEKASNFKDRKIEGGFINKSLLALCNLVTNLQNNKNLGFRDSKLTRILQPSLNGKTNIVALCMITPKANCIEESVSTLKFAGRLANLKIKVSMQILKDKKLVDKNLIDINNMADISLIDKNLANINLADTGLFNIHDTIMKQGYYKDQYKKHYMKGKIENRDDIDKGIDEINKEVDLNDDSSESIEFKKNNTILDFYEIQLEDDSQEERSLLLERISSLEKMLVDLLKKHPSKRTKEIFILEKHMFNLKLQKFKKK